MATSTRCRTSRRMIDSYHCSRYNTQTRRLTDRDVPDGAQTSRDARRFMIGGVSEHADRFDPREYIPNLPRRPGVYRMYSAKSGELLYVGKARSLRDRVGNYFLASNVDPEGAGAGRAHRAHRSHADELRDRGAAARVQPHQGTQAALQHRVARRQELSVHLSTLGTRISAAGVLPRRAQPAGKIFRAVPERRRRQGDPAERAEDLPHPELPRHLLRESQPALPAAPDRPLLGALREADLARGLCARHRARRSRCSRAATTR